MPLRLALLYNRRGIMKMEGKGFVVRGRCKCSQTLQNTICPIDSLSAVSTPPETLLSSCALVHLSIYCTVPHERAERAASAVTP